MRRGVKVRRVLRRFELWPVAKVAFFFHFFCYALTMATLTGGYLIAQRMGSLKNLEQLMTRLGWEEFTVHGDVLFRASATIGAALMAIATVATVTLAFFYNSLSSIFGGLVVSVLQEYAPGEAPLTRRGRRKRQRLSKKTNKAEKKARKKADKNVGKNGGAKRRHRNGHSDGANGARLEAPEALLVTDPEPAPEVSDEDTNAVGLWR